MAGDKHEPSEPTQTTPKGAEIPIPTRDAFLRDLEKASRPDDEPERPERREQGER